MDALKGVGGQAAKARSVGGAATARVGQAKALAGRTNKWDKKLVLHLLLYLFFGLVLGTAAFLDFFGQLDVSMVSVVFIGTAIASVLLGVLHLAWTARMAEGYRGFGGEFGITSITTLMLALGLFLGHRFFPLFIDGETAFAWMICSAAIAMLIPFLVWWAFDSAMRFEERRYDLWYYPKNYQEKQPTWDKDRVILANLHFKLREQEDSITTVNVRMPLDAMLGELVYLFIKDYNENRFPASPITALRKDDGSLGWLFRRRKFLFAKQRMWPWYNRVLDPKLTIAQNGIGRNADVYFERVMVRSNADE